MNHISMVEANLPPGFRFHPRDEELVCDYLIYKITHGQPLLMIEVDLNKCEPWDIPDTARVGGNEWYFYSQRDRKYATGLRTNRATAAGYWKATGKDRPVYSKNTLVGMRKTLVFYEGRAPKGRKTEWVMHEFRLEGILATSTISFIKEDWVLCRVFCKNKEVAARASMGSCYDDSSSSPLPPLMDSYIRFDQTQPNLDEYEQVPCFSIFSENQTNPIFNDITHVGPPITHGDRPMTSCLDPISSDKQVIKAALNQVTKMNSNLHIKGSSSLVEASPESYLSEVGVPQHIETFLM